MSTETDTAKTAQQDTSDNRPYAVILYGATSFVGQITAHYLTNFLSKPVISGFTSGAAIVIIISQLKSLLKIEVPSGLTSLKIN